MKGVSPVHLDHSFHREASRRDELTKTGSVLVEHPTVGADEGAHASWCKHLQRSLEESHVQIRPADHGFVAFPVHLRDRLVDGFEAHVRRVADHEVYSAAETEHVEVWIQ